MPRAIAGGLCLVIVCYLLVNVSYLAVLGPSGVLQTEAVAVVRIQTDSGLNRQTDRRTDRQIYKDKQEDLTKTKGETIRD